MSSRHNFLCIATAFFLLGVGMPFGALAQTLPTKEQVAFVKQCVKAPATATALDQLSRKAAREVQVRYGAVEAPLSVKLIAHRLIQASPELSSRLGGVSSLDIRAYEGRQIQAQLNGVQGLMVSSALWRASPALDPHEQAAVFAHELAHLEGRDLQLWGCFVQSRLYPDIMPFSDAMDFIVTGQDPTVRQFLHEMEEVADKRARELLHLAGFDPKALDRVLSRPDLLAIEPSFTHPGSRQRLQSAATPDAPPVAGAQSGAKP